MKTRTHLHVKAFTLVELLVVIAIIAILAGVSLPVMQNVLISAKRAASMQQARQISLGLKQYASDHGGIYPTGGSLDPATGDKLPDDGTSNDYLRVLLPSYVQMEEVFYVAGSAFCDPSKPDEVMNGDDRLAAGENHWAYIAGQSDTSHPAQPLLADGWADPASGTYTDQANEPGGVWRGEKAIVIRIDGSADIMTCNAEFQVTGPRPGADSPGNLFTASGSYLRGTTSTNPALP